MATVKNAFLKVTLLNLHGNNEMKSHIPYFELET